jgi:hypothetical protein
VHNVYEGEGREQACARSRACSSRAGRAAAGLPPHRDYARTLQALGFEQVQRGCEPLLMFAADLAGRRTQAQS